MKILHTADLHIGAELAYLENLSEERKYEVLQVFKNICQMCSQNSVDVCLIAGDLFDSNAASKIFSDSVFRSISEAKNTRFFYVAGNHDPLNSSSPFTMQNLPENLTVFGSNYQTVLLDDIKLRITGRSFTHSSMDFSDMEAMPQDEYLNILLLHADIGENSVYNPVSSRFIENCGADYIALGHIHKRTSIEKIGSSYVAYCGCPEGQGFDEVGEKGVYLGEITKEKCSITFHKCSKRLHIVKKIDLSNAESLTQAQDIILNTLSQDFGDQSEQNLYKLILTGYLENPDVINIPELLALLKTKLYFVKIKNHIKQKVDLELLSQEVSLKGIFVRKMLDRIKSADTEQQKILIDSLYLGLRAFEGEVSYDED